MFIFNSTERHKKRQGSLYVQVEPKIIVGAQKTTKAIPLDSIRCQTVLAKCLGPLSTWESKLIVAKNSGFNMIHFTPIQVNFTFEQEKCLKKIENSEFDACLPQELGISRSAYSLKNQLKPNPDFNDVQVNGKIIKNLTFESIEKLIKKMRTDWGVSYQLISRFECFKFHHHLFSKMSAVILGCFNM